jgi:hypothetical protein
VPETVPGDSFNDVALDPKSETVAGLVNYRFESPLVFFNADYLTSRVRFWLAAQIPRYVRS